MWLNGGSIRVYVATIQGKQLCVAWSDLGDYLTLYSWLGPGYCGLDLLGPELNGRRFTDTIFKCIFFKENVGILIKFSLKIVPQGQIDS